MRRQVTDSVRPHVRAILHFCRQDLRLLMPATGLLAVLCWLAGYLVAGALVGVILTFNHLLLHNTSSGKALFRSLGSERPLVTICALALVNVVLFCTPAVLMALSPSVALKISSVIWLLGLMFYIIHRWSQVPPVLKLLMAPPLLMLFVVFAILPVSDPIASPLSHWVAACSLLFIFLYLAVEALSEYFVLERGLRSAQLEAKQRLAYLEETQRFDALTQVLTRPAFDIALHVMLQDRAATGGQIVVFLADLDGFKPINDTYSHEAGDQILIATAQRLNQHIGDRGVVGRLGGDEFIIAVEGLADAAEACALAEALLRQISLPIQWNGRPLKIAASIGIAMTNSDGTAPAADVSALCSAADQAMFAAKSSPMQEPQFYRADLFAPRLSAADKQRLIESIAQREIKPHYQPKVLLASRDIIGFEALARWEDPVRGLRMPSEFIEQINEFGLQGDFIAQMARQVTEDILKFCCAGLDPGQVSLNVPEVALATQTGHLELQRIVSACPNATRHLTFEITEDVFIARSAGIIQTSIATFREMGVRISLDDFGTGFASFNHLRQLDFDELKIDTSFVAGLGKDRTSEVLVSGLLNIASGLGVSVIAEGVETEDQRRDLINLGCISAQGYLFGSALPVGQALRLLEIQQAAA